MVTFRIESTSRWDALALANKLPRYNYWFLIEPDQHHWDVCVPLEQASPQVPEELRRTIIAWLRERHLEKTVIHTGSGAEAVQLPSDAPGAETSVTEAISASTADEPHPFFASQQRTNDQVVVRLGGDCDAATIDRLNSTLQEAVAQQPTGVIVDLAEATFIDSLALSALLAAAKRVRATGGSFRVIRALATEVRRAFEISGLDKHLLESS